MQIVILAAGYATRLYPLTKNFPKPLLDIGGQSILDRLLTQLRKLDVDSIYVVCNKKFEPEFLRWQPGDVKLLTNDSTKAEDRLGAVGDLQFAIAQMPNISDVLVVAADNLFEVNFDEFLDSAIGSKICIWHNPDKQDQRKRGNVRINTAGRVEQFIEKPEQSISDWSAAPLYYYAEEDVTRVSEYLALGGNPDAPGHFVEWLAEVTDVNAYILPKRPTDIGTLDALLAARQRFS